MSKDNEPQGIPFYRISTGETLYAKSDPQIQGFINSSDMGINASRGQDFMWRLAPEWVKMVRKFRLDEAKMERLADKNGGKAPTVTQILYAIYGEQLRAAKQRAEEEAAPYEEQYLEAIKPESKKVSSK